MFKNKSIVITGATGSLGKILVKRILSEELGRPKKVVVFSRDEAKQHSLRLEYQNKSIATDEIIYQNFQRVLQFVIGDIRDFSSVVRVLRDADIVFNAAALKQVPTCEYFPYEAVQTNIIGAENIVRAIHQFNLPVDTVIGISTDKACKPVNVMGMTKAIQERIFIRANLDCPKTRFICVRYGNVLVSRGSVIPLFLEQIKNKQPVTVTSKEMTRFLLTLDQAVDVVFTAVRYAKRGEICIPKAPSARIVDIAQALIGKQTSKLIFIGMRPGEKIHESLISQEEGFRTTIRGKYYIILPILPELRQKNKNGRFLNKEYCSKDHIISQRQIRLLLQKENLFND